MDDVFNSIWTATVNDMVPTRKRKTREICNVYNNNSDNDSIDVVDKTDKKDKNVRPNFVRRSIEAVELYTMNGLPSCCKLECLNKFCVKDIENCRMYLSTLNYADKKAYIHAHIEIERIEGDKMKRKIYYKSVSLCVKSFQVLFGISKNLIYSANSLKNKLCDKDKELIIITFLNLLASLHDIMPDKHEIHLSYNTHRLVFEKFECYLQSIEDISSRKISYSYFNKVWRRKMSHIKARKAIRFSKCGKCVKMKENIMKTNKDELRTKLKKELFRHIERMTLDRKVYQQNKEDATKNKQKCLSAAIDGADFQRYGLPYFCQKDKDSDKGFKNPIRTVGIIVHGHGNIFFTFSSNVPSDSNCIVFCLHETIATMKKVYAIKNWTFPDTLHLQV